ncbi:MAG: AhpC/TSA family protein [Sphingobacterium sp.]|jgi:peroxiredoxin|nr:AhpC/TSA family protein [Sphingobacterium sp.]
MKHYLKRITLTLCFFLPLFAQGQNRGFSIDVKLEKLPATAMAYLIYTPYDERKIDSVQAVNGRFVFKGDIEEVTSAYLLLSPKGDGMRGRNSSDLRIFLEPGPIHIYGVESLNGAIVKAGQVNSDHTALNLRLKPIRLTEKKLYTALQTAEGEQNEKIKLQLAECMKQKKQVYEDFISNNPDHFMSFFALKAKEGAVPQVEELEPYFNMLDPKIRKSKAGTVYSSYLATLKAVGIGIIAPQFAIPDTNGTIINLSNFKGKYVLVDFWASWCKPCREENPNLRKAYVDYKNKGLEIISISLDYPNGRKAWTEAIRNDQLEWTQVSELLGWKGETITAYFVKAIPQNFLLDPQGKIIAKDLRGAALQEKLEEIYK